jgi:DNA invertase Pin-like site-specific DNA recombinase
MKAHAANEADAIFYKDKFTGKSMSRPGWEKLWADACSGKIDKVVVWRLDRLGRTVSGLSQLFEEMQARKINLVSIRDGLSLLTPSGRLQAHILASVAVFELEIKTERQVEGILALKTALENGTAEWKRGPKKGQLRTEYGSGRKAGTKIKMTGEVQKAIRDMKEAGKSISEIARVLKMSRVTIYAALKEAS